MRKVLEAPSGTPKEVEELLFAKHTKAMEEYAPYMGEMFGIIDFDRRTTYGGPKEEDEITPVTAIGMANVITSCVGKDLKTPAQRVVVLHRPLVDVDVYLTEERGQQFEDIFDMEFAVVKSTTSGHAHLYGLDLMEWGKYIEALKTCASTKPAIRLNSPDPDWAVLEKDTLVEDGYYFASKRKGCAALRLPWVKKEPSKETTQLTLFLKAWYGYHQSLSRQYSLTQAATSGLF